CGEIAGAVAVDLRSLFQVALGAVDVRPRRAVDEDLRTLGGHHALDSAEVRDVEVLVAEPDHLVPPLLRDAHDIGSEHAARSCDQQPHRVWIPESSATTNRYALGSAWLRRRETLRPIRLASIRPPRSEILESSITIECSISERSIVTLQSIAE